MLFQEQICEAWLGRLVGHVALRVGVGVVDTRYFRTRLSESKAQPAFNSFTRGNVVADIKKIL